MPRPDVDRVTGVPPSIALEQRTTRAGRQLDGRDRDRDRALPAAPLREGRRRCIAPSATAHRGALDRGHDPGRPASALKGARTLLAPAVRARKGTYLDVFTAAARAGIAEAMGRRQAGRRPTPRRGSPRPRSTRSTLVDPPGTARRARAGRCLERALSLGQGRGQGAQTGERRRRGDALLDAAKRARAAAGGARARSALVLVQHQAGPLRGVRGHRRRGRPGGGARRGDRAVPGLRRLASLAQRRARCGSTGRATTSSSRASVARALERCQALAVRRRPRQRSPRRRRASSCGGSSFSRGSGSATCRSTARPHALRRRDAAPAPRRRSSARAHRRALRARRADDRPAPARHRAPAREPARARRTGSTVLVVEHDAETIRAADHLDRSRAVAAAARRSHRRRGHAGRGARQSRIRRPAARSPRASVRVRRCAGHPRRRAARSSSTARARTT